ncbi:hypothetical protein [Dysgonomonas mossii]|nr:hypothetical protein [Dysgonomonas mossii]
MQTPKDGTNVGANPCGRPHIKGQGQATVPTYTVRRSFGFNYVTLR